MKSFRDVYRKFLLTPPSTAQQSMFTSSGVNLPFFYLRNNNFCALFQRDKDGSPQVVLNPTKTLAALIAESKPTF
jgi:hypothetical protein